mmetsp:Transcript_64996/g.130673  ORF Transcript_64996/g.130673 Transcript_64996/m.130673 type:complete len:219 (+) Transcript_64996:155-811(+)
MMPSQGLSKQPLSVVVSHASSMPRPMKTARLSRAPSGQGPCGIPPKWQVTAWKMYFSSRPFTSRMPFMRYISLGYFLSTCAKKSFRRFWFRAPLSFTPTALMFGSCSWSSLSSKNVASNSSALSREKARTLHSSSTGIGTLLSVRVMGTTFAKGFTRIRRSTTESTSASVHRSVFVRSRRSAKATCSEASLTHDFSRFASSCVSKCFVSQTPRIESSR